LKLNNLILGIDEAGRGSVMGPMVICGILVREERVEELKRIGVRDSKLLSPSLRLKLKPLIESLVEEWSLVKVSPQQIDRENLNLIELRLIVNLIEHFSPSWVMVDCPLKDREIFCQLISQRLSFSPSRLVVENKADLHYPPVAAASILAKLERDREVKILRERYGDFGSGYPGDRRTRLFLKNYYRRWKTFPPEARKRWKTLGKIENEGKN